ncbi:hypothetical protein CROQUDRAFT_109543 [Cronartium quercuum f. sp. fusiforme G11]|uniref:Uncharacterized protein n=1 Tax=Cronartium quercuum f. sp. fusiforme G11 TaxID=708437 RepID=A0A9P6T8D4_9BASI|nr:hypothetical protein CROQUDRAFT_109543 [Cronartium quercuum f. sp. fusiforme G11]
MTQLPMSSSWRTPKRMRKTSDKDRALNITEDVFTNITVQTSANAIASRSGAHIVVDEAVNGDLHLPGNRFINPGTKLKGFGLPAGQTSPTIPNLSIYSKRAASVKAMTNISGDEQRTPRPKRIMEIGLEALARSIESAVEQDKLRFSNEESMARVKKDVAMAKMEKYPYRRAAMTIFNATAEDHFNEPLARLAAADILSFTINRHISVISLIIRSHQ